MEIYVKKFSDFYIVSCFWWSITIFSYMLRWFYLYRSYCTNTATDNVTNEVTHRISNTNVWYSCAHFICNKTRPH